MNRIVLQSPAKLNLYLKIKSKRPDGFHNIVTLFERIDLTDTLTFRKKSGTGITISCNHPHVPVGPKNLVYRVARLLQEDYGIRSGVHIRIQKNIPVAAGLAGGSTNAATALLGLNKLWKIGLSRAKLASYGRKVGSDVPFFLYDASWALGTERGDRIRTLKIGAKLCHILVVPKVKLYAGDVYGALKFKLTKIGDNANILTRNLKKGNILEVGRLLDNDLEKAVLRLCPQLEKLKERLKSLNTKGVMVSGSGPGVFGITATEKDAKYIKSILSKRFKQVFVVKTL